MLKIIDKPIFGATVSVATANVQGSFNVQFFGLPTDELDRIETEAMKAGRNPQKAVLHAVVAGFEPVALPNGETLAYGQPDALERLCNWPGIAPAMVRRYYDALWEERRGNSERLPGGCSTTPPEQPTTTPTPPAR